MEFQEFALLTIESTSWSRGDFSSPLLNLIIRNWKDIKCLTFLSSSIYSVDEKKNVYHF